jgi:pectate lyase
VIFDVGGIIDLAGSTLVLENPFITIAGQSSPYPGITIIDGGIEIRGCNDVIIQHIRVRPGAARHAEEIGVWEPDGIATNFPNNVIIDHCSISCGVDENLTASGPRFDGATPEEWRSNTSRQITFSNNIIAEALAEATHSDGKHSRASLIHDNTSDIAIIKNLYAHNNRRTPLIKAGSRGVIMNNVIYNPGQLAMHFSSVASEWADALATVGTPPDALI